MSLTALFNGIRGKLRSAETQKMLLAMTSGAARSHRTINKTILLAMKLTAIILLTACMVASAHGNAQRVSINAKGASLEKIFQEIKKQTGYTFVYRDEWLQEAKKVDLNLKNASLEETLNACFKDQPLSYTIVKTTIVIQQKEKSPNGEATIINEPPPPIDVTGKITDVDGNPLIGASVKVKGTSKGTMTNNEGVFVLKGVDDNAVLEISYIGFELLSIPVNNRTSIVTSLKAKPLDLNEVIINKGPYTEKQRYSVSNVATVTSKDIEKQPVQNPLLTLQGRVPGLVVTQMTGINGGAVQVRIQGQNSFRTDGLEPLIIIDGVPYPSSTINSAMEYVVGGGSPLNYIAPSDIESISVLKDADATAIYGSRAANGAVLITTKKGKAGKPKLSVDVQQGWGKVSSHVDMMNTRQYLDMRYEAYKNDNIDLASQVLGSKNYDLKVWDTTRYTNWQKELIGGTAKYTNVNASVSGGSALVQYMVGANYNRQTTVFPGNFDNKSSGLHFSLNGSSPNQRLRIQLSGSYQYNQNGLPGADLTPSAVLLEPNAPKLYNEDGSLNWAPTASGRSTWDNPLIYSLYTQFSNTTTNLVSSMNIGYTILPGLNLSSNFGYNNVQTDLFTGRKMEFNRPENQSFSQRSAEFGSKNTHTWIIEPQLQLEKKVGRGLLDALIGATAQKSASKFLYVRASGQPTNELLHSLAAATSLSAGASGNDLDKTTRFNGLFGRVGYNWDKKYLINLTGRRDGSSKFGPENRFHNFWSVGGGWIFSEEKFLQSSKSWLSFGKLRASYGTTGNDQITDYSYMSLYSIVAPNILYQGTTSFNVAGLSNPFLQWEETRKLQGGIDLSAFNERIAIGVTYFRNRSSNQLIQYSLPALTGFTSFTKNFPATIQNTGWEFSLNSANVKSKNFNWTTNFNLTIPRNKVVSFPGIELTSYASGNSGVIVGEPIGIQKRYQYAGVDPATGSYLLFDSTGKVVDPNVSFGALKQSALISLLPKFYGGMANSINYMGFQLDFLFQFVYQLGSKDFFYYNDGLAPGRFGSGGSNQPERIAGSQWQKPGDNATIGRFTTGSSIIWPSSNYSTEGYSYEAGSYIRLKNVSLSWQLPYAWSKSMHLQTARLYFRGQNLGTITGYKGLDPETRSITTLPPLQIWTVGAKIEL